MSTVIKSADGSRGRLTQAELVDHFAEAVRVLERAREEAAQIIGSARIRSEHDAHAARAKAMEIGHRAGWEQGFKEGRQAGFEEGKKESTAKFELEHTEKSAALDRGVDALIQMASSLEAIKDEYRLSAERHLLEFTRDVVARMTFETGKAHRESAVANLRRALEVVGDRSNLMARVNPVDFEFVREQSEKFEGRLAASSALRIVADESLRPGGCVVESAAGLVDASLETQVAELVAIMAGGDGHA